MKIIRIDKINIKILSDSLTDLQNLVLINEEMYPDIKRWFKKKVIPELKTNERIAYVGYINDKPIASAIVKQGELSKICHLKINKKFQNNSFGKILFSLMLSDIKDIAKEVYFTLPESLWEERKKFFQSFGFNTITKTDIRYRTFENELKCSSSISNIKGVHKCHILMI